MIFFLTLTVRGPFRRTDFKWKKALYVELNERAEAATSSYSFWKRQILTRYLFRACR